MLALSLVLLDLTVTFKDGVLLLLYQALQFTDLLLELGELLLVLLKEGTLLVLEFILEVSVSVLLLLDLFFKEADLLVSQGSLLIEFRLLSLELAGDILVALFIGGHLRLSLL